MPFFIISSVFLSKYAGKTSHHFSKPCTYIENNFIYVYKYVLCVKSIYWILKNMVFLNENCAHLKFSNSGFWTFYNFSHVCLPGVLFQYYQNQYQRVCIWTNYIPSFLKELLILGLSVLSQTKVGFVISGRRLIA